MPAKKLCIVPGRYVVSFLVVTRARTAARARGTTTGAVENLGGARLHGKILPGDGPVASATLTHTGARTSGTGLGGRQMRRPTWVQRTVGIVRNSMRCGGEF